MKNGRTVIIRIGRGGSEARFFERYDSLITNFNRDIVEIRLELDFLLSRLSLYEIIIIIIKKRTETIW